MKACRICERPKSVEDFYANKGTRDGRAHECIECVRQAYRDRCRTDPEFRKRQNETSQRWRHANPERYERTRRDSELKAKFGLTHRDYEAMLAAQGGGCAICGGTLPARGKRHLHIDHNHATGAVRGVLCHSCNAVLGFMHDRPDLLRRAADYLEVARP